MPDIANCWRTTGDIDNTWQSIIERAVANDRFADAARPGAFNDPDMLGANGNTMITSSHFQIRSTPSNA
eukprot:SAG31_NODE_4302_length_3371_cov_3.994193_3_plen_69_part_00